VLFKVISFLDHCIFEIGGNIPTTRFDQGDHKGLYFPLIQLEEDKSGYVKVPMKIHCHSTEPESKYNEKG